MRLGNGIEVDLDEAPLVHFTKLIDGKLYTITVHCNSVKSLALFIKGVALYTPEEFKQEALLSK